MPSQRRSSGAGDRLEHDPNAAHEVGVPAAGIFERHDHAELSHRGDVPGDGDVDAALDLSGEAAVVELLAEVVAGAIRHAAALTEIARVGEVPQLTTRANSPRWMLLETAPVVRPGLDGKGRPR